MFKIILLLVATFSSGFPAFAMEAPGQPSFAQEDNAARVLQQGIRKYNNRQKIFEKMYQQGGLFRDGKVEGYKKGSFLATARAAANFFPLAHEGNVKAQHNLAMIYYGRRNYTDAWRWLSRAADQGFQPSVNNLQKLIKEMEAASLSRLPHEIGVQVACYLDDNSLLLLRIVSRGLADIVEEAFHERASIKTPLVCFSLKDPTYPYRHTGSYFLRKRLWQTENNTSPNYGTYLECAKFCSQWNYIGETVFRILGDPASYSTETIKAESMIKFWTLIEQKYAKDNDSREMQLFGLSNALKSNVNLVEFFIQQANELSMSEKKDIACFYFNKAGNSLSGIKQHITADKCYEFSVKQGNTAAQRYFGNKYWNEGNIVEAKRYYQLAADQSDIISQFNLGSIFEEEGNIVEAKRYYQLAADQGYVLAQFNLGHIFKEEGKINQAIACWKLAAAQNDLDAQFNLGIIFREKGNIEEAKRYFQLAADRGFAGAQYNLGVIFKQEGKIKQAINYCSLAAKQDIPGAQHNIGVSFQEEGNLDEAKKYYRLAANQGYAPSQNNLGSILCKEGNLDEAKRFFKLAADQGFAEAQYNLGLILKGEGKINQAKSYWKMAAEQGHLFAQYNLSHL